MYVETMYVNSGKNYESLTLAHMYMYRQDGTRKIVFYDWHCYNSREGLEHPLKSEIEFYRRKMGCEWRNRLLCGMLHARNWNRADTNM